MEFGGEGGEILTVQLGSTSNHVGTHFWNIQDELFGKKETELRPELLYRTGMTCNAVGTRTPRMVLLDFKHSLGSLKPTGTLYDSSAVFNLEEDASQMWGGGVEVHEEPLHKKNQFLTWLEEGDQQEEGEDNYAANRVREEEVSVWSDYLKSQYHPKSTNLLHKYGNIDFDCFTHGKDLFMEGDAKEEFFDSIRFFLEECGRVQGFHILVDVNSGYGSIAQEVIQELKDDARSAAVITFGVTEPDGAIPVKNLNKSLARRAMNQALSASVFSEMSSLYIPLPLYTLQNLRNPLLSKKFKPSSLFQTSALAATAIDTMSLAYRRKKPGLGTNSANTMSELTSRVAPTSDIRIGTLSMAFPFPYPSVSEKELDTLVKNWSPLHHAKNPFNIQLSTTSIPSPEEMFPLFGSSMVMRGVQSGEAETSFTSKSIEAKLGEYAKTGRFLLEPAPMYSTLSLALPIAVSFPDILNNSILGSEGEIRVNREEDPLPPYSVPVWTHVENSSRIGKDIDLFHSTVKRATSHHKYPFTSGRGGLDDEDFDAVVERLDLLKQEYVYRRNY